MSHRCVSWRPAMGFSLGISLPRPHRHASHASRPSLPPPIPTLVPSPCIMQPPSCTALQTPSGLAPLHPVVTQTLRSMSIDEGEGAHLENRHHDADEEGV
jgi:hypothetical protein